MRLILYIPQPLQGLVPGLNPELIHSNPWPLEWQANLKREKTTEGLFVSLAPKDSIAPLDAEFVAALQAKHPTSHPDTCMPPLITEPISCSSVSVEEVALAICYFPNGADGGPDGLCLQHLKDMVSTSAWKDGEDLV